MENYRPDLMWFDFGLRFVQEDYKKRMLADYYNKETEWDRELAVTYKSHDLVPGVAIVDYELGRMDRLTYYDWITDYVDRRSGRVGIRFGCGVQERQRIDPQPGRQRQQERLSAPERRSESRRHDSRRSQGKDSSPWASGLRSTARQSTTPRPG